MAKLVIELPERRPKYKVINGHKFAPAFDEETIRAALAYKAKSTDFFIVTYPKCGTTWTQQICILLFNDGNVPEELSRQTIFSLSPFLESMGPKAVESMPIPGAIKTHLPFWLQPYHQKAKYLYVLRNPRDACVSYYYHTKLFKEYCFAGDIHDYLKCWLLGEVESGSYAEHVLSWWKHRNDDNVLCLFYEEMQEDVRTAIRRIADFLGPPYSDKVGNDQDYVHRIAKNSLFSNMKEAVNRNLEKRVREMQLVNDGVQFTFMRKGIVGDWRNHLTQEETELFDDWFLTNFRGTGLESIWDKYNR